MTIRLGDEAPNFHAQTTAGAIDFHDWIGNKWAILFSHPADFTPVCSTELAATSSLAAEFESRGVKVIALSVDSLDDHQRWLTDIEEYQGEKIEFPLIADSEGEIANLYGMIHPQELETMTVRSLFVIDPDKKVRLMITYPASCGRNFPEILRVIDSLQLASRQPLLTPANWNPGEECIVAPAVPEEELPEKFPQGVKVINSYLRTTLPPTD